MLSFHVQKGVALRLPGAKDKVHSRVHFLHENELLPLPDLCTLYGYLGNLKADFGFDVTLFTVLREKLKAVWKDSIEVRSSTYY
ncbi:hypothetical protein HPB48_012853 [Haemaphysalis longicornis]|uniref:Uncharacterized protein n=1 Tax=Haemaphysalis longicornis TaxID=44386 RepID=A0A9J6GX30_HAELO|nr:hypothetical protein HPB48_012853 [Haemaphysalis longicornis]